MSDKSTYWGVQRLRRTAIDDVYSAKRLFASDWLTITLQGKFLHCALRVVIDSLQARATDVPLAFRFTINRFGVVALPGGP